MLHVLFFVLPQTNRIEGNDPVDTTTCNSRTSGAADSPCRRWRRRRWCWRWRQWRWRWWWRWLLVLVLWWLWRPGGGRGPDPGCVPGHPGRFSGSGCGGAVLAALLARLPVGVVWLRWHQPQCCLEMLQMTASRYSVRGRVNRKHSPFAISPLPG